MSGLVDAGKNLMLNGFSSGATFVSLHTSSPSTNGANEVSASPYTREAVSWASAASGSLQNSAQVVFDVPGSTTITHLGYWSASTSGTFYGSRQLDTNQTFATAGTYTIGANLITESIT
jgi:hypothetical protein